MACKLIVGVIHLAYDVYDLLKITTSKSTGPYGITIMR
jgi:hypothetical protein